MPRGPLTDLNPHYAHQRILPRFNRLSVITTFRAGSRLSSNSYLIKTLHKPYSIMSLALSPPALPISPHAHRSPPLPPMSILRRLKLHRHQRRRFATLAAAAVVRQDTTVWTQAPLSVVEPAADSLFHVAVDLSDSPDLASSHTRAGQYLQLRVPNAEKPSFLAIASPPSLVESGGAFEFLVKSVGGSTAELLCGLKRGDVVELSQVMGKGFDTDRIDPPEDYQTVLIFATGSGIRFVSYFLCLFFIFIFLLLLFPLAAEISERNN